MGPEADVVVAPETTAEPPAVKPAPLRTPDDDIEDALKKAGGLKYRAGGKDKSLTALADIKRLLSRVDGTQAAGEAALKERAAAAAISSRVEAMASMRPGERLRALEELGISAAAVREAVEEEILAEDAREKSRAGLSSQDRERHAALDAREAELSAREAARARWEQEQQRAEEAAQSEAIYARLSTVAARALQKLRIAPEHATAFLPDIAAELDRKERLGLDYSEDDIAETVLKRHGSLARNYYAGLDADAHLDELRSMPAPDPDAPGKTTTRLRLLMRAEAKRIRARQSAGDAGPTSVARLPAAPGNKQTDLDKLAAASTFGGGVPW